MRISPMTIQEEKIIAGRFGVTLEEFIDSIKSAVDASHFYSLNRLACLSYGKSRYVLYVVVDGEWVLLGFGVIAKSIKVLQRQTEQQGQFSGSMR